MYRGERFNSLSHLTAAVLSGAGLVVLIILAALRGDPWRIVSFSIYGATLFLLYLSSTLYHSLRGHAKNVFRRFDHLAIYLLIAGSYTPFTLVSLRGDWGWSLFGVVWGLAVLGIIQEFIEQRTRLVSILIYLFMGWLALIAIQPLTHALPPGGLAWLVVGGIFYTVGTIFFALDNIWRYAHEVWHVLVIAGSASHYFAIVRYVA